MAHIEIISDNDEGKCIIYLPQSEDISLKTYTIDYFKINKNTRIFEWNFNANNNSPYFFTTFYKMEAINKIYNKITSFTSYLAFTIIILEAIKDVQNEIFSQKVILNNDLIFIIEEDSEKILKDLNVTKFNKLNIIDTIMLLKKQIKFINLDFSYKNQQLQIGHKLNLSINQNSNLLNLNYLKENTLSEYCLKLAENSISLLKKSYLWTNELENNYLKKSYQGIDAYLDNCYKLLDYFFYYDEKNTSNNFLYLGLAVLDKLKLKNNFVHNKKTTKHNKKLELKLKKKRPNMIKRKKFDKFYDDNHSVKVNIKRISSKGS